MIKLNYPSFWQTKSLLSYAMLPLSLIYFLLGKLRQLLSTPCRLPAKVICIGNATIGGTGKSQVAIWLTKKLIANGIKPVILCKGYGGSFKSPMIVTKDMDAIVTGDEALELCEYATTVIARNPKDAVNLLQSLSPSIIIVDDGMQNPGFIKDFIIMVVDGKRGFGNQMLFPAGPMRQSVQSAAARADSIIVTNYASESENIIIKADKSHKAIISPELTPDNNQKYYAFTGIGNPDRFFKLCKSLGNIVDTKTFPDHHKYTDNEIIDLRNRAAKSEATLITTKKDYVKLRPSKDIIVLNVTLEVEEGGKIIDSIMNIMKYSNE